MLGALEVRTGEGKLTEVLSRLLAALAALAGRRALLVLDNCEHLVAAAARLAGQVLAACPQVRILATSREPLAITGEALWTVGPLTMPPDPAVTFNYNERGGVPAPAIDDYTSVRLLAQRARAVLRGFEVTLAEASRPSGS
jgi:predicted ATPase